MIAEPQAIDQAVALRIATAFEGHPDNAAPAIHGGATVAWIDADGPHASELALADSIETAVLIPESTLPTKEARAVLPPNVPHTHAAFNVGRAALLVNALGSHPELLLPATEDKLHQTYRADVMAPAVAMLRHLRGEGYAAVVSGAGPSVLVLGTNLAGLTWPEGMGGEEWTLVHTAGRVAGATAKRL
jgi:homoserine kinase